MINIKQESFSENQWNQFIKNFENQFDTYFSGYQDIIINESLVTDTINLSVDLASHQAADIVKSKSVKFNID